MYAAKTQSSNFDYLNAIQVTRKSETRAVALYYGKIAVLFRILLRVMNNGVRFLLAAQGRSS